jgi:chloride channel protein, CIC family
MDKAVLTESTQRLSENARALAKTAVLGSAAALSAVAFLFCTNFLFARTFLAFATRSRSFFLLASFLTIMGFSGIVALLLRYVAPEAAGSGIPQLKAAYWKEMGYVDSRGVAVKFVAGVLSIAGGNSLGREGPSVYVGGGIASNLSGVFGISRRERRSAVAIGAAASLASAFNTPLAAITFVIEEIIGDFNSRYLGRVLLASVLGAFVVHALIGGQPAFSLRTVESVGWSMYLVVPVAAALAALGGVAFQKGTLALRGILRGQKILPRWALPIGGGFLTWVIGILMFLASGKIGVFGLGYQDLSAALNNNFPWKIAGAIALAKLAATIVGYGFGGSGGIFAPSLFIGGMIGFFTAGLANIWIPLSGSQMIVLAAIGMSCCLGAIVRAPLTSLLIVFEMTHQFELIPGLLIGLIISQAVARAAGHLNFYDALLVQDGHALHKIRPPLDLAGWQNLPVSAVANDNPIVLRSTDAKSMKELIDRYPYGNFPVVLGGVLRGLSTRQEIEEAILSGEAPEIHPPGICYPDQTIQAIGNSFIESSVPVLVVVDRTDGAVLGIVTLHDLIRTQAGFQQ